MSISGHKDENFQGSVGIRFRNAESVFPVNQSQGFIDETLYRLKRITTKCNFNLVFVKSTKNSHPHARTAIVLVWLAPLLIMAILVTACSKISEKVLKDRPSEGVIEYRITFPHVSDESITATLLPEKMTYAFTKNSFASNFETAGGVFRNKIVANRETRTVDHQLKVFRKKIHATLDESEVMRMLAEYPKAAVIKTNQIDTIAGFPCRKALVVFEDVGLREIEIFYTKEIDMESPNWCTQYHEIDGVLMAYEVEEFGIRMKLTAEEVHTPLEDEELLKPETEYAEITKDMMDVELEQLVQTFEL
jgi:hypothetical protein